MSSNLASVPEDASPTTTPTSATLSPATKEQRRERLDILHRKLRPPPFTHRWEFWFDGHQDASKGAPAYENRVKPLHSVGDVKDFWDFVNNTPISILKIRDSIHLFKKTVKPVWEDPRNLKGGSWTFRVSKDKSEAFWNEVMMFAVGEALQEAVASQRGDDICGVTISNRFNSHLVQIWNRDGSNQKSIDAILAVVMENISPELKPKPDSFYYKKHSEHRGYNESVAQAQPKTVVEARIEASPEAEEKAT